MMKLRRHHLEGRARDVDVQALAAVPMHRHVIRRAVRIHVEADGEHAGIVRLLDAERGLHDDAVAVRAVRGRGDEHEGEAVRRIIRRVRDAEIKVRRDRFKQARRVLPESQRVELRVDRVRHKAQEISRRARARRLHGGRRRGVVLLEHVVRGAGVKVLHEQTGGGRAVVRRGGGVPLRRSGRIAAQDFRAVQIRHEAVVVAHPQRERFVRRRINDRERHAQVGRRVHVRHRRAHVETDGGEIICPKVVAHADHPAQPRRVIEEEVAPARADVANWHQRAAGRACAQQRFRHARHDETVREILILVRELRGELRGLRHAVRPDQREIFAARRETEVRVQRSARHPPVLARREDDHERVWRDIRGGELPLGQERGVVRERPAARVHVRAGAVVNFNPVREGVVLVPESRAVHGHELGDDQLPGSRAHG